VYAYFLWANSAQPFQLVPGVYIMLVFQLLCWRARPCLPIIDEYVPACGCVTLEGCKGEKQWVRNKR
jgi:hypothetical protein